MKQCTTRRGRLFRIGPVAAVVLAAAVALPLAGTASAKTLRTAACSGPAVHFGAIGNFSNSAGAQEVPELKAGLNSAAAAITKSCELGGRVVIDYCDDKFDPNGDAACGRQFASSKPAAVFTYVGFGDSDVPLLTAAGVPVIPVNSTSQAENTDPLSFPLGYPITAIIAQVNIAASTGHKKIALAYLDLPSVAFLINIAQQKAEGLGATIVKQVAVPLTATDMGPYAGQVISSGADAVMGILGPQQVIGLFGAVRQQGAGPSKILEIGSALTFTGDARKALGSAGKSMLLSSWALNVADKTVPSVKQMLTEWRAAKQPLVLTDTLIGPTAWGGLHMVADALKAKKLPATAENVKTALNANLSKVSQQYGLNPINYTKNAYATDPVLSKLRLFSSYQTIYEWLDSKGTLVPLKVNGKTSHFVGVLHLVKIETVPTK